MINQHIKLLLLIFQTPLNTHFTYLKFHTQSSQLIL
ncbi:unnamed protein product [Paramecium sonneborni]|uniref:Uncharacterized protein n=1 Tax=Paramecium sonneborni TaxID=65129 RepID=A0A8S1LWS6_9CILI|nr:unnamed protein product [Paramecium sonneborni]